MRYLFAVILAFAVGLGAAAAQETPRNLLMLDTGGHMALIRDIAFTPDGRQLVSASDDKTIRVRDLATGETVRTIPGESAPGGSGKIYAMALSPDGKWLAAGGWTGDNEIRLYDFASGRLAALLKGHQNVVYGLAFSPDGRHLISGSADKTAIIWETESLSGGGPGLVAGPGVEQRQPKHRLTSHTDHIYAVGFTPDGARAVTGSLDHDLRLWRVADGEEIAHMPGHGDKVRSLAVTPDGTIASGDLSGEIRLWDGGSEAGTGGEAGAFRKTLARQGTMVGSLSFSPDGKTLLSGVGTGTDCHVYDLASGREIVRYSDHDNVVLATAISPDGRWAATGGGNNNEIHLWDLRTGQRRLGPDGQPLTFGGQGRPVWAAGFAADGRSIAWGDTSAYEAHGSRGPLQHMLALPSAEDALPRPRGLDLAETGAFRRAAASQGAWSLKHRKGGNRGFDAILDVARDGKTVASIERGPTDGDDHRAYSFTPDGETIISGGASGWLTSYDRQGNKRGDFIGHEGDVFAIAPSHDGRFLLSGSADQTLRLWNLKTRDLLVTLFHGADGEWVMWTPEGFFIASENGGKLVGWQINQGPEKEARYVTADQVRKLFNRPSLVAAKIAGDEAAVRTEAERLDINTILASGPPPDISILTPGDGWEARDRKLTVTFEVADRGGGAGRIELRVNNTLKASMIAPPGTRSFEDVELAETDNRLEIVAYNEANFVESKPAGVSVKLDPKTLLGVPDLYVLAIGVNTYKDQRRKLDHAVSDAKVLGETLAAAGRSYYRNPPHVVTLDDENVTAERLTQVFAELGARIKATDVFVFFIAGHGKTYVDDYYFVPPALTSFDREEIVAHGFGPKQWRDWFEKIAAEKSVFIFDTCESGSASGIFNARGGDYDASHRRLIDATGRVVLMAASDQQLAIEGYRGHGVFTYAILEALAKADKNRNGAIELTELMEHVDERVPQISRELKACRTAGPEEYCQRPEVATTLRPFYTLVPRYQQILARLESGDIAVIPEAPTHAVLKKTLDVWEQAGRGGGGKRTLNRGDQVRLVRTENGWMLLAREGKPIGYVQVEDDILLKLNP